MDPQHDWQKTANVILNSIAILLNAEQSLQKRREELYADVDLIKENFDNILTLLKNNNFSDDINQDKLNSLLPHLRTKISRLGRRIFKLNLIKIVNFKRLEAKLEKLNQLVQNDLNKHSDLLSNSTDYQSCYEELRKQFDNLFPEGSGFQTKSTFSKKFFAIVIVLAQFGTYWISFQRISNELSSYNVKECTADGSRKRLEELKLFERIVNSNDLRGLYLQELLRLNKLGMMLIRDNKSNVSVQFDDPISIAKSIDIISRLLKAKRMSDQDYQSYIAILESLRPLINVLANNREIEVRRERNVFNKSHKEKIRVYKVAVFIPLTNELPDPISKYNKREVPYSWSLGILRGIDIAQKAMLNEETSEPKIYLQAVIINDNNTFREADQSLAKYVASDMDVIGLIGHNQYQSMMLYADCYADANLPVITTSMPFFADDSKKDPLRPNVYHLLPPKTNVASRIVEEIKKQRNRQADFDFQEKPELVVFFDSRERSSTRLRDAICSQSKNQDWSCKSFDIVKQRINPLYRGKNEMEWIIAFNPNIGNISENRERIIGIVSDFARQHKKTNKRGWIYFGPDVVDEILENSLKQHLCGIFVSNEQKCNEPEIARQALIYPSNESPFDLIRLAPRDWRSDGDAIAATQHDIKSPFYNKNNNVYGDYLNWNVFNAYNAMMTFQHLIRKRHSGDATNVDRDIVKENLVSIFKGPYIDTVDSSAPHKLVLNFPYKGGSSKDLCAISLIQNQEFDCDVD